MEASPIDLSDNVNDRQMRREIDILMKSPTLKKGIFLQATKSYVKKKLGTYISNACRPSQYKKQ